MLKEQSLLLNECIMKFIKMSNPSQIPAGGYAPPLEPHMVYANMNEWTTSPQPALCRCCGIQVVTQTEHKSGAASWMGCLGLTFLGCIYGCCLLPFCINETKDVIHYCPHCQNPIGIKKRITFSK